jgi:hypothetical protein
MRLRVYFSLAFKGKQPAAAASGVHKLTIDSAPKGAEAMPTKLPERLVLGVAGFIMISSDNGGDQYAL